MMRATTAACTAAAHRPGRRLLFQRLALCSFVAVQHHPVGSSAFVGAPAPRGVWRGLHQDCYSSPVPSVLPRPHIFGLPITRTQQRFMMSSSSSSTSNGGGVGPSRPDITHVNREQMEEIVEDFHGGGREDSGYCVIDVRTDEEVVMTGKLAESVPTLPVQVILQSNVFALDPEEFEEICGFAKPDLDETLVFTCAAGIRSVYACQAAAAAGYSKLVNYVGGANEWFGPRQQF